MTSYKAPIRAISCLVLAGLCSALALPVQAAVVSGSATASAEASTLPPTIVFGIQPVAILEGQVPSVSGAVTDNSGTGLATVEYTLVNALNDATLTAWSALGTDALGDFGTPAKTAAPGCYVVGVYAVDNAGNASSVAEMPVVDFGPTTASLPDCVVGSADLPTILPPSVHIDPLPTPTPTPTAVPTATPTVAPTATPTATPVVTATAKPIATATATPVATAKATATATPSPTASATASPSPAPTASASADPTPIALALAATPSDETPSATGQVQGVSTDAPQSSTNWGLILFISLLVIAGVGGANLYMRSKSI